MQRLYTQLTLTQIVADCRLPYLLRHLSVTFKPLASTHPFQTGRVYLYRKLTPGYHPLQAGLVQGVSCNIGHTPVFKNRPTFSNSAPPSTVGALLLLSAPSGRFWQQSNIEKPARCNKYCYLLHLVGFSVLLCLHWWCTVKHKSNLTTNCHLPRFATSISRRATHAELSRCTSCSSD
jgi:hypothetical protein